MRNQDIRNEIKEAGLCLWQIANERGIADSTFSRWLRKELPDEEKARIRAAIVRLTKEV